MKGLKEMLLQEQKRLEQILQKTTEQLKDAPCGRLRVSKRKNWTQYYCCTERGKKAGTYISKKNESLIRRLAQKSYDEKILKLAGKRLM